MNMKKCGCHNDRKHKKINNSEKFVTLDIYLKFGSLDKMKITYSVPKYYLVRSVKGSITSLGIKIIGMSKKNKKSRYANTNVSMKDISKIIKEFKEFYYNNCVRKRPTGT